MEQHIEIRVLAPAIWMYSCHKTYTKDTRGVTTSKKNFRRANPSAKRFVHTSRIILRATLLYLKPKKMTNCGPLIVQYRENAYYSVFVYVCTYVLERKLRIQIVRQWTMVAVVML